MIKGLLFDYDDTLSDRGMSAYLCYCSILKRLFPEIDPASAEFEARAQQCMTWDEFGRIITYEDILSLTKIISDEDLRRSLNQQYIEQTIKEQPLFNIDVEESSDSKSDK